MVGLRPRPGVVTVRDSTENHRKSTDVRRRPATVPAADPHRAGSGRLEPPHLPPALPVQRVLHPERVAHAQTWSHRSGTADPPVGVIGETPGHHADGGRGPEIRALVAELGPPLFVLPHQDPARVIPAAEVGGTWARATKSPATSRQRYGPLS